VFIYKNKRPSITSYWTSTYLIALTIGILLLGIIMAFWIRHTTLDSRLSIAEFIAEDTASRITANFTNNYMNENDFSNETENRNFNSTDLEPHTYIINKKGVVIGSNVPTDSMLFTKISPEILNENKKYLTVQHTLTKETYYLVNRKIEVGQQVLGWVLVLDTEKNFTKVDNQYYQLIIALIFAGLIGWLAIYLLSKKLAKPLVEITKAAKKIEKGNYQIHLNVEAKEQEMFELIHSFKEMSQRLEKLEQMRTELLAGVTHELKTPITSISGLLQAVDENMVTDSEKEEFIQLSK